MEKIQEMFRVMSERDPAFIEDIGLLSRNGDVSGIIAAAAENGFEFTKDDWQAYTGRFSTVSEANGKSEILSESELEKVSGGRDTGDGSFDNPYKKLDNCWFTKGTPSYTFPNTYKCNSAGFCKAFILGWRATYGIGWYQCTCNGTNYCTDGFHKVCNVCGQGNCCGHVKG